MFLNTIIIIVFLLVNLLIGYFSSKKIVDFAQFSVGHRSFSALIIAISLSANFIGGGYTMGNAAKVYEGGMLFAFALLGFSAKEALVARFIAPRMSNFNTCYSIGDIIEKGYGVYAKIITGIFSLIICGGILGAQVSALGVIIHETTNINQQAGVFLALAVMFIYSSLGGMRGVVFTDVLQFALLAIGIPLTFLIGLHKIGGWHKLITGVPHHYLYFFHSQNDLTLFILLFFTFMVGEILIPPYVQRLLLSRSSKTTVRATYLSALISIPVFLLSGGIGLIAYCYQQGLKADNVFPIVVHQLLPIGISGIVSAALLSIILSSGSGLLNAAAIAFANDIVKPLKTNDSTINFLKLARVSTIIIGIIAVLFALSINSIINILLAAYAFWSPIMLIPLVAVIWGFKSTSLHFLTAAFAGIIGVLIWKYSFHYRLGITMPSVLFGILCNLLTFYIFYVGKRMHKNS